MDGIMHQGDERFRRRRRGNVYHFRIPERGAGLQGSSASPFAPKTVTGERDYSNYDVFSAVAFGDLSGGMGQERAKNPAQYYSACNVDARGTKLVLGPRDTSPARGRA